MTANRSNKGSRERKSSLRGNRRVTGLFHPRNPPYFLCLELLESRRLLSGEGWCARPIARSGSAQVSITDVVQENDEVYRKSSSVTFPVVFSDFGTYSTFGSNKLVDVDTQELAMDFSRGGYGLATVGGSTDGGGMSFESWTRASAGQISTFFGDESRNTSITSTTTLTFDCKAEFAGAAISVGRSRGVLGIASTITGSGQVRVDGLEPYIPQSKSYSTALLGTGFFGTGSAVSSDVFSEFYLVTPGESFSISVTTKSVVQTTSLDALEEVSTARIQTLYFALPDILSTGLVVEQEGPLAAYDTLVLNYVVNTPTQDYFDWGPIAYAEFRWSKDLTYGGTDREINAGIFKLDLTPGEHQIRIPASTLSNPNTPSDPTAFKYLVVRLDSRDAIDEEFDCSGTTESDAFLEVLPDISLANMTADTSSQEISVAYRISNPFRAFFPNRASLQLFYTGDSEQVVGFDNQIAADGTVSMNPTEEGSLRIPVSAFQFGPAGPAAWMTKLVAIADCDAVSPGVGYGAVRERDESNNRRSIPLWAKPEVRLIVDPNPKEAQRYDISIVVTNQSIVPDVFDVELKSPTWAEYVGTPAGWKHSVLRPEKSISVRALSEKTVRIATINDDWDWIPAENPIKLGVNGVVSLDGIKDLFMGLSGEALVDKLKDGTGLAIGNLVGVAFNALDVVKELVGASSVATCPEMRVSYEVIVTSQSDPGRQAKASDTAFVTVDQGKQIAYGEYQVDRVGGATATSLGLTGISVAAMSGQVFALPLVFGSYCSGQSLLLKAFYAYERAKDPPDPNYTTVAVVERGPLPAEDVLPAGASRFVIDAVSQSAAVVRALSTAKDRSDGARSAEDSLWESRQLVAASNLQTDLAVMASRLAGLQAAWRRAANAEPAPTPEKIANLRASGLPQNVREGLLALGMSAAEIDAAWKFTLDYLPGLKTPAIDQAASTRLQAALAAAAAIQDLGAAVTLRVRDLGEPVTPLTVADVDRLAVRHERIAALLGSQAPSQDLLFLIKEHIDDARGLILATNAFAVLAQELQFGNWALVSCQDHDLSPDGVIRFVDAAAVGAIDGVTVAALKSTLQAASAACAAGDAAAAAARLREASALVGDARRSGSISVALADAALGYLGLVSDIVERGRIGEAPRVVDQRFTATGKAALAGTITATDADDRSVAFGLGAPAEHGIVSLNQEGSFTYTPTTGFIGTDSFQVAVSDGFGNVTRATVVVDVTRAEELTTPGVALARDTGRLGNDGITHDPALAFTDLAAGATLEYSLSGGAWSAEYAPADGIVRLRVRQAKDSTVSDPSTELVYTLDRRGPRVITTAGALVAGQPATLDVAFDEAVDEATVAPADFSLVNPAGKALAPTSIVRISDTVSRVFFPAQGKRGSYRCTAGPEISDLAGNRLDQNANGIVGEAVADTYAAAVRVLRPGPIVALKKDTGSDGADRITTDGTLAVTGTDRGVRIEYSVDSGTTWKAAFAAAAGKNEVRVRQTDTGGEVSAVTTFAFTLDTTAPAALLVTLNRDSGASAADRVTSDGSLAVSAAETGAKVEYSTNGGSAWKTVFTPANGRNVVQVRQTDIAGNPSKAATLDFTLDTKAPAAPTIKLSSDTGSSATDRITRDGRLAVNGIESGATVAYSSDAGATWKTVFTPANGKNVVQVRQTDIAGNPSKAATLDFTLDTTAAAVAAVVLPTAGDFKVGATLTFRVTFSEAVTVPKASNTELLPSVGFALSGLARKATYASGSGTKTVVFTAKTVAADRGRTLASIDGAISCLAGYEIRDAAGNLVGLGIATRLPAALPRIRVV